jgi:hypothetical protein
MLTQTQVKPRILGLSKMPSVHSKAFVAATGNNIIIEGDLTRRTIICRLDPKVERPELRQFHFIPEEECSASRLLLVVAVLTILHAFQLAGSPRQTVPLGGFENWSSIVRDTI